LLHIIEYVSIKSFIGYIRTQIHKNVTRFYTLFRSIFCDMNDSYLELSSLIARFVAHCIQPHLGYSLLIS